MKNEARFWDRIAARYANKPVPDADIYARKLALTREYLTTASEVFEFGCGTGTTALHLAPYAKHIRATDFSPTMIDIAEGKRVAAGIANVSFECATLSEAAADGARYDMVLGHSIVHLMADWRAAIDRVHDMLRPGGIFVSSTACIGDDMAWLRYVLPVGRVLGLLPRVVIFTAAELEQALLTAGFTLEHQWHPGKHRGRFIIARVSPP